MSPDPIVGFFVDVDRPSDQAVVHGSFAVALDLSVLPSEIFSAYSELALRQRWFRLPGDSGTREHELDFRIGGGELTSATFAPAGISEHLVYRSRFLDIVPDERIVLVYEFLLDDRRRWVSLVTLELAVSVAGTRLSHTEQFAFLEPSGDGESDIAHLKGGTRRQLNGLAAVVKR
ncbi:MAG: hypothetical protein JWO62_3202 [Acidimicrobiaceae bacterium]|nr:hypothetical protein [Acidimicrobiaceae bacterium]